MPAAGALPGRAIIADFSVIGQQMREGVVYGADSCRHHRRLGLRSVHRPRGGRVARLQQSPREHCPEPPRLTISHCLTRRATRQCHKSRLGRSNGGFGMRRALFFTAATALLGLAAVTPLQAQSSNGPAADAQRKCQTIKTCRYDRGGSFRGCLSSYTCRVCSFVKAKCEIGGRTQNCQEMRCTWGG